MRKVGPVPQLRDRQIQRAGTGVELAVPIAVALIRAVGTTFAVSGAAQRVGFRTHQGVKEHGQQLAQYVGVGAGESIGQPRRQVDIVGSGHRVYSFARVTLDGLSKNHAMTFNHSATTRRYRSSGPTRTPLCWTQPETVLGLVESVIAPCGCVVAA